jgi:lipopolysaccharide/colanic/teichoic acid biosynthesis glycosyltransferase
VKEKSRSLKEKSSAVKEKSRMLKEIGSAEKKISQTLNAKAPALKEKPFSVPVLVFFRRTDHGSPFFRFTRHGTRATVFLFSRFHK